jgi:hypothetical protein
MSIYELMAEDDDVFVEEDEYVAEDVDEAFTEEDEFGERKPRRGRRPPRIRAGRTAQGRGFVKPKPSRQPVSTATLQASLERVGQDIRTNAAAIKRLEAQVKTATSKLNSIDNVQDKSINDLRKELKNQGSATQQQNQMNMLLPLLQKSPELEARPGSGTEAGPILNAVQIKKQDSTLPLIMMMMASSQSAGAGGANSMNMLLPMMLLLDR